MNTPHLVGLAQGAQALDRQELRVPRPDPDPDETPAHARAPTGFVPGFAPGFAALTSRRGSPGVAAQCVWR